MGHAHDNETRQRRLEEALQQSEQRFERLVEAARNRWSPLWRYPSSARRGKSTAANPHRERHSHDIKKTRPEVLSSPLQCLGPASRPGILAKTWGTLNRLFGPSR
jgi:hypothetical protein